MSKIAFLGAGNLASALVDGLLAQGKVPKTDLACLGGGIARIREMVPRIYGSTIPPGLYPAAARSVFAHVIDLAERGAVAADGPIAIDTAYRLAR